ncbi:Anaphase promoting complex subunit 7 [Quaeritorhiza haematococci]|nr:Anaphase promoting complex subunit 7 [Quaeritorhiza haematococci]
MCSCGDVDEADLYLPANVPKSFYSKAIALDSRHVGAYQKQGTLLLALDRPAEAAVSFSQAHRLSKNYFSYQGLMECYLQMHQLKEALGAAKEALGLMPKNPRALAMVGLVLAQMPEGQDKALQYDPKCTRAVLAMVSVLVQEENLQEAVDLLESHIPHQHTADVHCQLANIYTKMEDYSKALENYNTALRISPEYEEATNGIARVEKLINGIDDEEEEEEEEEMEGEMEGDSDVMEEGDL